MTLEACQGCQDRGKESPISPGWLLDLSFGEAFSDGLTNATLFFGPVKTALGAPAHAVEQSEPILEGRVFDGLPLVVAAFSDKETPFPADVLGIDLELNALLVDAFPADFGFGHGGIRVNRHWRPPWPRCLLRGR